MNRVEAEAGNCLSTYLEHKKLSLSLHTGTNGDDLLDQFKEYWNNNFFSEGYDLAHLWTGKDTLERVDEDGQKKKLVA